MKSSTRLRPALLLATIPLLAVAPFARAADFHVSPKGDDTAGDGSTQKPFATPGKAVSAVRAWKGAHPGEGNRVVIHAGEYELASGLTLTPEDSGTPQKPFVIEPAPGEKVALSGGHTITGWSKVGDIPGLPAAAQGKVYQADIPKGWLPHGLFVDGTPNPRARLINHARWRKWPKNFKGGALEGQNQVVTLAGGREVLKKIPANGDVEMLTISFQYGGMIFGPVTGVDLDKETFLLGTRGRKLGKSRDNNERGYNFENAAAFLDEPGEWFVDSVAGKIVWWPAPGVSPDKAKVVAARANDIVFFKGDDANGRFTRDIVVRGFTLKYADRPTDFSVAAAARFEAAENCVLEGCDILHVAGAGVRLGGGVRRNRVEGCRIRWTGTGGIVLGGRGPAVACDNRENIILRNVIEDTGLVEWNGGGIGLGHSGDNRIALNLIQRTGYAGITMSAMNPVYFTKKRMEAFPDPENAFPYMPAGTARRILDGTLVIPHNDAAKYLHTARNLVERNLVVEPEQMLDEGGAIYAYGTGHGNIWRENIVFKSSGFAQSSILALDNAAEYFTLTGNVIWVNGRAGAGTIGVRPVERGNVIHDNVRVQFDPKFADPRTPNLDGVKKGFYRTETGRESLDKLLASITAEVGKSGGWLGNPKVGIPGPGEPMTKGKEKDAPPKDAHLTIE